MNARLKALGLSIVMAGAAGAAAAQDLSFRSTGFGDYGAFDDYNRGHNITVLERERPEFDALGLRRGAWLIYPRVDSSVNFTDNVFATRTGEESDFYFGIVPSVSAVANWSRHEASVNAGLRLRRHVDFTNEDQDGYFVLANGRYDAGGDNYLLAGASTERRYEPRTSSGSPAGAVEPVEFYSSGGYVRGVYQMGRLKAGLGGDYRFVNYIDAETPSGARLSQRQRDRGVTNATVRGEWAVTPDFSVFGLTNYSQSDYSISGPQLASRDSDEVSVLAGASFDLTTLIRGSLGAGYVNREYESSIYPDIDGLAARVRVEYLVTQLTTITFSANRDIEDSVLINSGGYFSTRFTGQVDHELKRNVLLRGSVGYETDKYQGVDREDEILTASAGGTYLVSRSIGLSADVYYTKRDSAGQFGGVDYDAVGLSFAVVLQR